MPCCWINEGVWDGFEIFKFKLDEREIEFLTFSRFWYVQYF